MRGQRDVPAPQLRQAAQWPFFVVAWIATMMLGSTSAAGYWTEAGTGSGTALTGSLTSPTAVTASATSTSDVPLTWTAPSSTPVPTGYYITRLSAAGVSEPACGSSPTALIPGTSCTDTSVPDGSYSYTVTAVLGSWTAVSAPSGTVAVATPASTLFTASPGTTVAGAALTPAVEVALRTADGRPAPRAGVTVTLALESNPGGGTLSGLLSAVTDSSGTATFSGLSIDKAADDYTILATSTGLTTSRSDAFSITAAAPTRVIFTSDTFSGSASANASLGPATVQMRDTFGNPVPAPAGGTALTLSSSSGTGRFSATASGPSTTTVTIAAGSSTTNFYYGDTTAGSSSITVSGSGLASASQSVTIAPAAPERVVFTSTSLSGWTSAGASLGPATVQLRDAFGNTVAAPAGGILLTLSSSSITGKFSATASGSATTTVTIPAGSSTVSFYLGDTTAGTPTITVTGSGLNAASQSATITPAPASVAFTSAALSGAASTSASLGPATVQLRDASGNAVTAPAGGFVLSLSSSSPTARFSALAAGTAATTVTIPAGSSTTNFYYGDTTAGTPTLTVSRTGLTSATQSASIVPATAAGLKITQQPTTGASNRTLTPAFVVRVVDAFGNFTTVSSATPVTVATDRNSTPKGTTAVTVNPGGSEAVFSELSLTGNGVHNLTFSAPGLAPATASVTIS